MEWIILTICIISCSLFVYSLKRIPQHSFIKPYFAAFGAMLLSWLVCDFFFWHLRTANVIMVHMALGILLTASAIVFVKSFSEQKKLLYKELIPIYGCAVILAIMGFFDGVFIKKEVYDSCQLHFYPAWILYGMYVLWGIVYGFHKLIISLKKFKGVLQYQTRYFFLGLLSFGCIEFLIAVVLPACGKNQYSIGNAFCAFLLLSLLSYAVLRYQLLGITVLVKWSSVLSSVAMLLTGVYIACLVLLETIIPQYITITPLALRIIIVALIALTLVPFRNIIRKFLLSLFLSREKELEQELDALKRFLMTQIEFEGSVLLLVGELESILRVQCVTILMHDEKVQQYKVETSIGCEENIEGMSRNDVTPLFDWLNEHQRTAVKKWLDDGTNEEMLAAMEHIEAVLCIPMFLDETVRGIIALGEKKWRKYTVDEIQILERFANEIVIVLQNILEVEHKISPPKPRLKNPGYVIRPTPFPGWVIIDDPPPDGKNDDDKK